MVRAGEEQKVWLHCRARPRRFCDNLQHGGSGAIPTICAGGRDSHDSAAEGEEGGRVVMADKVLDCTGLFCPEPVFRTRMALDELAAGQTLEVHADDPAAFEDLR